ncbi:hypothetical protein BD410DRAFT_486024 [Rickenella mellea]|uniref:Uncharacterized protein n=1 Tax=Rickenella mellea TaxID=50990 RepID=A0A4Y7QJW0_9AGAM|nr:hypothetical protein BD410DRAFT_486024 [Rickenella mellea]
MAVVAVLVGGDNIKITPVRRQSTQVYPPQVAIKHFKRDVWEFLCNIFFGVLIVPYYIVIGLAWGIFGVILFLLSFGMIFANAALGGVINM